MIKPTTAEQIAALEVLRTSQIRAAVVCKNVPTGTVWPFEDHKRRRSLCL